MATATNINGWNVGGNNNSFDQRGHFYRGVFSGNVTGMRVKQNSTPNMTVLVEHGSALLNKNSISASIAEIKSDTSVTIDTANTSNPRIDTVVIYEDTSVAIPTVEANYWQDGAGGRFKIVSLPGTAAASPVALSDSSIQSAIGAGKPWTRLADITVPANSTTIVNSNIADKRSELSFARLVGYYNNINSTSDINVGGVLSGSTATFSSLDPAKRYLVHYSSNYQVNRISADGTTASSIRYKKNNGSFTSKSVIDRTIRSSGSGADNVNAAQTDALCFTGVSTITIRIEVTDANAIMRYTNGSTTAYLYEVTSTFITNI